MEPTAKYKGILSAFLGAPSIFLPLMPFAGLSSSSPSLLLLLSSVTESLAKNDGEIGNKRSGLTGKGVDEV